MRARSVFVAVIIAVLLLFVAVNWSTFNAPTHLSLVVTSVDAPLGLVMLGATAVLAAALLSYALKVQFDALRDRRRLAEELRQQRALADQAEASRFTELRASLDAQFSTLRDAQSQSAQELKEALTTATNTLAACIGQVDERLERQWPTSRQQQP